MVNVVVTTVEGGRAPMDTCLTSEVRRWRPALAAAMAGAIFAAVATAMSWQALADRRSFDLPLRGMGAIGIVVGLIIWGRGRRAELGQLVMGLAVSSFIRDFRASTEITLFTLGFWFSFLWLAIAAHIVVSGPSGKLTGRQSQVIVAASYLMAVGSQIGRYIVDRPQPGWLLHHPLDTTWARVGSGCAATMALVVGIFTVRRWTVTSRAEGRPLEPVWAAFIVVAVASTTAAIGAIVGVPDGQIELIPSALAVCIVLPAGWVYMRMRAQLDEVRASRQRVLTAAFEERRRIQADLHDSTQQDLWTVLLWLDQALRSLTPATPDLTTTEQHLRRAHTELRATFQSLRDLVQGIYPTILEKDGLSVALESIADQSPIPLVFHVAPARWNHDIERTIYFIVREAVGNSARHAQPSRITVTVRDETDHLFVEVSDDGHGGAVPLERGGLRSLHDRAVTVGGALNIDTSAAGTRVTVRLPKEQSNASRPGRGSQTRA